MRYGPEKVIEWTARRPGRRPTSRASSSRSTALPLERSGSDWIEFERDWQEQNLDSIRTNPTTPTRDLSPTALGSVSRAYIDHDAA